jgi:tetratricopeptide (TPR) repeat protein
VDDDLLRGLDWEIEEIEDGDARELVSEAIDVYRSGEVDDALDTVERALVQAEVEATADDTVVAELLILRATCLAKLKRMDEAIVVCQHFRDITGDRDGFLRFLHGLGTTLEALLLAERGEHSKAIDYLTEVVDDFADDQEPRRRALAVDAQGYRIRQVLELDQPHAAVAQWKTLLDGFGGDPDATVLAAVAGAGADAATFLLIKAQVASAHSVAADVIERFESRSEGDIRASVALAMCCRWAAFRRRGRMFAYWRSFQEFLAFVGTDPEPEIVEAIREAYPPKKAARLLSAARVAGS